MTIINTIIDFITNNSTLVLSACMLLLATCITMIVIHSAKQDKKIETLEEAINNNFFNKLLTKMKVAFNVIKHRVINLVIIIKNKIFKH